MAVAFQSTGYHYAVGAFLEGPQHIQDVELTGTRQLDHLDRRWVIQSHRPRKVGSSVGAVPAAKGYYLGLKSITTHKISL